MRHHLERPVAVVIEAGECVRQHREDLDHGVGKKRCAPVGFVRDVHQHDIRPRGRFAKTVCSQNVVGLLGCDRVGLGEIFMIAIVKDIEVGRDERAPVNARIDARRVRR